MVSYIHTQFLDGAYSKVLSFTMPQNPQSVW